ncbi:MAG: DUF4381 domain-containing protein [Thermodesulfobacteriota bacterium]
MADPASLQNLHDIVIPPPVPWWPPAPGWYGLFFCLLLAAGWLIAKGYRTYRANGYRREALNILDNLELEHQHNGPTVLPRLAQLIKRTAIGAYGRPRVASLSGDRWLRFLDRTGNTTIFTAGDGQLLIDCSTQSPARLEELSPKQVSGLFRAVRGWMTGHQT